MRLWPDRQQASPPAEAADAQLAGSRRKGRWSRLPKLLRLLLLALLALVLWYGGIGGWKGGVHYDIALRPSAEQLPPGGSTTLGLVARLIRQQVDEREFTPNDPFFYPTALARRTMAFQTAALVTLRDVVQAMARIGGSDSMAEAAAELSVPPEQWWLNGNWPFLGRPAEWHYRQAAEAIGETNRDLAGRRAGQGTFIADPADRNRLLRALLASIDSEAARGDRLIRDSRPRNIRVQIARARGTAYAATILLRGLSEDNATAIRGSGRAARWSEALDALDEVVRLDPWIPRQSDLVLAGYSLLIAGNAIRSILEG